MCKDLYKAKRLDNGEWVTGCLVEYPSGKTEIHKKGIEPPDLLLVLEVDPTTICRCVGKKYIDGEEAFENDRFVSSYCGLTMALKYGTYQAWCPMDACFMDNVGFYAEAEGYPPMPIGNLQEYAWKIGNLLDHPVLQNT